MLRQFLCTFARGWTCLRLDLYKNIYILTVILDAVYVRQETFTDVIALNLNISHNNCQKLNSKKCLNEFMKGPPPP